MERLFDIKGKVIAITGGGGVLCGTMAKALGEMKSNPKAAGPLRLNVTC
jgi:hypothetical protein